MIHEVRGVRFTPDLMMKIFGFRAEGECNRQARLAEGDGDTRGARRWRVMAEACRQHMGEEPTNWRFKGPLF